MFTALGITLTPAERAAIEAAPTRNVAALLAYSRGVRDETFARYGAAAQQYRAALQADPNFIDASQRMLGIDARASSAASATTPRRSTRAESGNRAAQLVASNVNSSLADFSNGGATGAVAVNAASSAQPVQQRMLVTITLFIQPRP